MVKAGCHQDRWELATAPCGIHAGSRMGLVGTRKSELFVPGRPPPYASWRIRGRPMTAVSLKSPTRELGEERGGACVVVAAVATPRQSEAWLVTERTERLGVKDHWSSFAGLLGQGSWCGCSRNMEAFRRLGANEHTQHVVAPGSYSYQQSSAADARVQVSSLAVAV